MERRPIVVFLMYDAILRFMGYLSVNSGGGPSTPNFPQLGVAGNGLEATIREIDQYLMGVQNWVLKSKEGLTREQARRIFQRYHSPSAREQADAAGEGASEAAPERQTQQIQQILHYMEQTTQRLDLIENDIGYIKEKVDTILKRL